jgi:uncharacterized cupredoxin-like copper-binding protein
MVTRLAWIIGAAALLLAACGGESDPDTAPAGTATPTPAVTPEGDVIVILDEWSVEPAPDSAPAGEITFAVVNDGASAHELTIYQTDLPLDELPLAGRMVDETKVEPLGSTPVMVGGQLRQLTVTLAPGRYVLVCNLPTHYEDGMRAEFNVE